MYDKKTWATINCLKSDTTIINDDSDLNTRLTTDMTAVFIYLLLIHKKSLLNNANGEFKRRIFM